MNFGVCFRPTRAKPDLERCTSVQADAVQLAQSQHSLPFTANSCASTAQASLTETKAESQTQLVAGEEEEVDVQLCVTAC